jgi:hypothetical protein
MSSFKEARHLFHFAGLFVLAFIVFWAIRGYVVPKSFGQYGHYRGNAIGEIAARSRFILPVTTHAKAATQTCWT